MPSSAKRAEINQLRAELQRVEMERDILKKSRDHLCASASINRRYQFIWAYTEPWLVQGLCRVLAVSAAGYYQWCQRPAAVQVPWCSAAQTVFARHAYRYGTRRSRAEGHAVGRYALLSWLRHQGLYALSTRPQRPHTTVVDPAAS